MKRLAFSYRRFSTPEQYASDSAARQDRFIADYCKAHNLTLDKRTYQDFGVSASARRKAAVKGNALKLRTAQDDLQTFLDAVANGDIAEGSVLIVEALDRLTRAPEEEALPLLLGLVAAGVEVVCCQPQVISFKKGQCDIGKLILAVMYLAEGHANSRKLSVRIGDWWAETRKEGRAVTHLPAWLEHRNSGKTDGGRIISKEAKTPDQKYVIDEAKAGTVRLIFRLCVEGMGADQIVGELVKRKVKPIVRIGNSTKSGIPKVAKWSSTYVGHLLTSRAVMGYYTPHKGKCYNSQPIGPERIEYPEIIDPELFAEAQVALASRRTKGGKRAKHVNLFNGLLHDAISGLPYWRQGSVVVVGRERLQTDDKSTRKIPYAFLERAILTTTRELNAADLQPERKKLNTLYATAQNELVEVQLNIGHVEALLKKKARPELYNQLEALLDKRDELQEALKQTRQAEPFADQYGQYVAAIEYAKGDDDKRQQLAGLIKRVVRRITVATYVNGYDRGIVAQVEFTTGEVRAIFGVSLYSRAGNQEWYGSGLIDKAWPRTGKWWEGFVAEMLYKRREAMRLEAAK